ncbi:diguanylate cyclase domain-containing protein [Capilliphycus salinus ALCB114379]|uniref:diguanylate cyclase domain-containing protein n=1 Tax=Capilliphycus salinus TaxID=2768948 RepID=UPI0039A605C3
MSKYSVNILIIDDHLDNLRVLSALLTEKGYQVRKARSGHIALETVKVCLPDLIILDIKMPDMSGYEVCRQLKARPESCEIPVIFISALDGTFDKVKGFQVGGSDYITKPFEMDEVLIRVENQLTILRQKQLLIEQNQQLLQEIRDRQQAEAEIRLLLKMTQAIGEAWDFETALEVTLCEVCHAIDWDYGEAWIPNDSVMVHKASQIDCCPDLLVKDFYHYSTQLEFPPNVGLVGRVWLSQKTEWIEDISLESEEKLVRYKQAQETGLKAALAVPIIFSDRILAVLVFFKKQALSPNDHVIELVTGVANQLGALMVHKKAEEALREAYVELERLAKLDSLTQIANRRYFEEYLEREWKRLAREKQPLSVILCDVDCFKLYNDCYGHQAGDCCLKEIAEAISRSARRPADLVARYGGEEFVIILPNTSLMGGLKVANLIREEIQKLQIPHVQSTVDSYVTVSLGVATTIPHLELSVQTLIRAADENLYQAKNKGRNCAIASSL